MLANKKAGERSSQHEAVVTLNTPFLLRHPLRAEEDGASPSAEIEEAVVEAGDVCGGIAAECGPEVLEIQFVDETPQVLNLDNQIRLIAKGLRSELSEFLQDNLRERPRLGYDQPGAEPLPIAELKQVLFQSSQQLEEFFVNDEDRSPLGISLRSFAQNLQMSVDSFRVYLTRSGFSSGVPESHYGEVMQMTLSFKAEVSSVIQELDAFMLRAVEVQQES